MAGNETAAQVEGQATTEEVNKFAGFAVKDGEVVKATPAEKQNANARPIAAKAADPAVKDDDDTKHASADQRIGQAVGRQRAAERRADAAETRAAATEARLAALEARLTGGQQQATTPKAPDLKDYEGGEYDARYLADVAKFEARQAVAEATKTEREKSAQTAQVQQQQVRTAEFQAKRDTFFAEAGDKYDDFEEVVGAPVDQGGPPISAIIGELAVDSPHGADILYELASDLKEARKVFNMPPVKQAAWFGRQEAAKEASSEDTGAGDGDDGDGAERQSGPKPKVSKAPAVPDFNSRGTGAVPKPSASTTDFAAFERVATAGQHKK